MPSCFLCCPAYAATDDQQVTAAVTQAGRLLGARDWEIVPSPRLGDLRPAGSWLTLPERLAEWQAATRHEAMWPLRGGYGTIELALALQTGERPEALPLVIGCSDLTALHALYRCWQAPAIYAPVAAVDLSDAAAGSLLLALDSGPWQLDAGSHPAVRPVASGEGHGPLFAACLRILASLAGTPLQVDLAGCLLAIEDIDERPYAVDRDLVQLAAAGCLDGIVALVANDFPHTSASDYGGPDHHAVIARWAQRLGVPAISGLPFGHSADPLSLRQGVDTLLRVDADGWTLAQPSS